jgi:DNA-binding transcriptional LysR family regulator
LRAFVAVADCGGFHRAAERFNLTQSTVSQQIKRLELETERLLFRRKVLVPIAQHIRTLNAARLAADVEGVSTILLCRTDAYSAQLLTSDIDERDRPFLSGERTREGFFRLRPELGLDYAIARSLACAPYADLLWWETSEPDLAEAERFAEAIHRQFPGKMLAYNCSPSFNWRRALAPKKIAGFQRDIAQMGYCFQFVTLAGFHSLNLSMFNLARDYCERGMAAYSEPQQAEFSAEAGATLRPGINAKSASAISMRLRRSSPGVIRRRPRSPAAPRWRSSISAKSRRSDSTVMTKGSYTIMIGRCTTGLLMIWRRAANSAV